MIVCRSQAEIEKLRRVNQLVGRILAELRAMAKPGVCQPLSRPTSAAVVATMVVCVLGMPP